MVSTEITNYLLHIRCDPFATVLKSMGSLSKLRKRRTTKYQEGFHYLGHTLLVAGNDDWLNCHRGPGRSSTRLSSSSTPLLPCFPRRYHHTSSFILLHPLVPKPSWGYVLTIHCGDVCRMDFSMLL